MMCWWPSGSPLPLLGNVLCHLSDHHCTTTAAASLSDCYGKPILHMDGNHCREILSCGLLKPMSFAPSSWWTSVIADNRAREGLFMFQVVLQPQLCPSTEILLSISLKWWIQTKCLTDAVTSVGFDIIHNMADFLFYFFLIYKFRHAFVPSYTVFSEDSGWDGLILPVPECSFEGLFRSVYSSHLQIPCLSPGDMPEKLRKVLYHRDV